MRYNLRLLQLTSRLIALPRAAKYLIEFSLDVAALCGSTALMMTIVPAQGDLLRTDAAFMLLGAPITVIPAMYLTGCYETVVRFASAYTMLRVFRGALVGFSLLAAAFALLGMLEHVWRLMVIVPLLAGCAFSLWRLCAAILLRPMAPEHATNRVLIYGAGQAGVQLASALMTNRRHRPIGFVDDRVDLQGRNIFGLKVFAPEQLPMLKRTESFERVLLAIPSANGSQRRKILESLEQLSLKVLIMPPLDEFVAGERRAEVLREVRIDDLLGRDTVDPIRPLLDRHLKTKSVMVTGAGGSIGSELCRQVLACDARKLVLFEMSEYALYAIEQELQPLASESGCELIPILGNVCDQRHLASTISEHHIETIYHAAAYKHVPLVEANTVAAARNNVLGTLAAASAAVSCQVDSFVLISTDKAVRPTSVMGVTKRVCELIVQSFVAQHPTFHASVVRFGNVLASSGSVVPLFRDQIRRGGPVTVTHSEATRYFMTIAEASQLVIQAGAMGGDGEIFLLDMGEPIRIATLAERMIRLAGLQIRSDRNPNGDICIELTGLRPGEKLHEELLTNSRPEGTQHPRIFLDKIAGDLPTVPSFWIKRFERAIDAGDREEVIAILQQLVDEFSEATPPEHGIPRLQVPAPSDAG